MKTLFDIMLISMQILQKQNVYSIKYTKYGFTLAEVLITLGIIGVVATLTIPTLMNNVQDAQFKTAWKKTFSTFANATNTILSDNSGSVESLITSNDDSMRITYEPYLNIAKSCPRNFNLKGLCWHPDANWFLQNGSPVPATIPGIILPLWGASSGDVLTDGTLTKYTTTGSCSKTNICAHIFVDVNGFKNPNVIGRDIFGMYLYADRIVPFGKPSNGEGNTCTPSDNGIACSSVYLYN